jgi:pyruvate ferredoxin oxidoreductase alpha subunit
MSKGVFHRINFGLVNTVPRSKLPRFGKVEYRPIEDAGLARGKGEFRTLDGNAAVAYAVAQASPNVVAAYPITPSTNIVHHLAQRVHNGELPHTRFVKKTSEHAALCACIGSLATGARTFTATSSVGFAYMQETMYWAAGARMPLVLALVNRSLGGSLNIWKEHDDMYLARDYAVLLVAENNQQAYDLTLMAFPIAEHPEVLLPTIANLDGFTISHTVSKLRTLSWKDAQEFTQKQEPVHNMFFESMSIGGLTSPQKYPTVREQQISDAQVAARRVIQETFEKYSRLSGRSYSWFTEHYMSDAKFAILCMGSLAGSVRRYVETARRAGIPVGLISLNVYRPFPANELAEFLAKEAKELNGLAIVDNALNSGFPPLFSDTNLALQLAGVENKFQTVSFLYGGGQNPTLADISGIFHVMNKESRRSRVQAPFRLINVETQGPVELDLEEYSVAKAFAQSLREIKFIGRGGQGAVLAAGLLAEISNKAGKRAQGMPKFGAEKTGSPTDAKGRVSEHLIHLRAQDNGPSDVLIMVDSTVPLGEITQHVNPDGVIIANSPLAPAEIRKAWDVPEDIEIYTVDASDLSLRYLKRDMPNTAMLAALAHINPQDLNSGSLIHHIREELVKRIGRELAEINIRMVNEVPILIKGGEEKKDA